MSNKQNEALRELVLRELARRDLKTFLRLKWARFNQMPFLDNWHFDYLCQVLQSTMREFSNPPLKRVMLNMPPSYGKTETIARTFIPWALGNNPYRKFIYISYSDDLGRKINKQIRELMKSSKKGLYNVAYNGKNAVLIKKDLEVVDEAILFEKGTKRKGGKHIRLAHSQEPSQEGYVTKQEVANLGVNIREYLKDYEPFIDTNGARLYEWEKEGVRFRAVVNDLQTSGGNSRLPSASEEIITFYSDRNLKEKMRFKNKQGKYGIVKTPYKDVVVDILSIFIKTLTTQIEII